MKQWIKTGSVAAATFVLSLAAFAQQQAPSQAVRLSFVQGQVRITDSSNHVITDQAVANTPLFSGYVLQTGDDGQAEVQFDDGTIARIPPDAALALTTLNGGQSDLTMNSGMAYFDLRGGERVHGGGATITASGQASIRVKLDAAPGEVAVFSGAAHVDGNGSSGDLRGGESVQLGGGFNVAESIEPDSWDAWNTDRQQAETAAAATATPATQGMPDASNPAWSDLNQNGNWYNVPDQGYVWSPYDASDPSWDPYGDGYWMDTPNYGYTWVSGYSWGYLPYQCGMWNWYSNFGWGWAPGGCTPWWRTVGVGGGYGWFVNVGNRPGGWRPPSRPNHPRFGGGHVGGHGGFRPSPVVAVRRQGPAQNTLLPLRDRRNPVTIGSSKVVPLRPNNQQRSNRPVYNHQLPQQGAMRFNPGGGFTPNYNSGRREYTPAPGNYNRFGGQQRPGGQQQFRPNNQMQSRPSAPAVRPAPAPHFSAPAPHFSAPAPHFSAPAPRR